MAIADAEGLGYTAPDCLNCEGRCSNVEILLSDDNQDVSPEKIEGNL